MVKKILILLFILLLSTSVFALEYTVTVTSPTSVNAYEGDKISNQFSAKIMNNAGVCDITCNWTTSAGQGSGIKVANSGGNNTFNFDVKADGSMGIASYSLIITCDRDTSIWNCFSSQDQRTYPLGGGAYQFRYLWNGDGVCTTNREKCDNYLSYLKDTTCSCPSTKECKPNGNRNPDSKGCQNYCGNGICEKLEGESCSSCQNDCKKCDLSTCTTGNECEGGNCVWGVCWNSATRINDGHCDSSKGENCGNSPADCACQSGQRCSTSTNQCETYCGNDVCESNENGICKADCKWCGDGSCDASQKESCKTCELDCGVCENQKVNEEIQEKTKEVVESGLKEVSEKQKIITYSGIGAIVLIIIGYIIFKIIKSKKTKKTKPLTEKKEEKPIKKKVSKKKKK